MSDNQSDIEAREVDEALRRERMQALWKENGKYVYLIAALVVLMVAGREIYTSQMESARQKQAALYSDAQNKALEAQQGDLFQAVTAWEGASDELKGDYKSLATLRLAAAKLEAGDVEGAVEIYDSLSRQGAIEEPVRDLARLLAAMVVADELGELEDALDRLQLVNGEDRPWRQSAREQEAYILLQLGRTQEARAIVEALSFEPGVPQGIRQRATSLRDALPAPKFEAADVEASGVEEPSPDQNG